MKLIRFMAFAALFTGVSAYATTFNECPAVGSDTSGCEFLITVTAVSGGAATAFTVTASSPNQGPFDGQDDTLVGILNDSGSTLTKIALSSPSDIFGFDGDGACSGHYGVISGCAGATDPSGYAPKGVTFTGINSTHTAGTVDFNSGLANGGSSWFSLEDALTASQILPGNPTPEPSSIFLMGLGLLGSAAALRRRQAAK